MLKIEMLDLLALKISLAINSGEIWAVIGANGSGKTTFLHNLANLQKLNSGTIFLENKSIIDYSAKQLAQKIGLLLQDSHSDFPATVYNTILLGRYPQQDIWHTVNEQDHALVEQALSDFDLIALRHQCVTKISGGEKRRTALAMLAVQQADIYLLDEPTNHLDLRHQLQALHYFTSLNKTIVMSLHDVNLAKKYCSHALLLGKDFYIHGKIEDVLTAKNLERILEQQFLEVGDFFIPDIKKVQAPTSACTPTK